MMPLITAFIVTMSLIFFGVPHFTAQDFGGIRAIDRSLKTINKDVPPIDLKTPDTIKTATFALG
jgi:hypothetical protein